MNKILCISPHPDDETLGCGGTLLRHKEEGNILYWAIFSRISIEEGWQETKVKEREKEIELVGKKYEFSEIFNFHMPTTKLDTLPMNKLIEDIIEVYKQCKAETIYMPYLNDVHTDHQLISKAVMSSSKWFRHPHIKKILMYETPSETEYNFIENRVFRPNIFVDISKYLDEKINIMNIYKSEMGDFPFPRSEKTIRSLAAIRGSQSGYEAAEAFELVYERK